MPAKHAAADTAEQENRRIAFNDPAVLFVEARFGSVRFQSNQPFSVPTACFAARRPQMTAAVSCEPTM